MKREGLRKRLTLLVQLARLRKLRQWRKKQINNIWIRGIRKSDAICHKNGGNFLPIQQVFLRQAKRAFTSQNGSLTSNSMESIINILRLFRTLNSQIKKVSSVSLTFFVILSVFKAKNLNPRIILTVILS